MTKKTLLTVTLPVFLILIWSPPSQTQEVVKEGDEKKALTKRLEAAAKEVRKRNPKGGFWIGYSIEKWMGENSFIGTIYYADGSVTHTTSGGINRRSNWPRVSNLTLQELISGEKPPERPALSEEESLRRAAEAALASAAAKEEPQREVLKQVAILFGFDSGDLEWQNVTEIRLSNLSLSVALKNRPLFWLGKAGQTESVDVLMELFPSLSTSKTKRRLISAIGLHTETDRTLPFVKHIALKDPDPKVRKEALYGLNKFRSKKEAREALEWIAFRDPDPAVQKEAVYRISKWPDPVTLLAELSQKHDNTAVRKESIYRLAQQKSSAEAVATLEDIVFNDAEIGVQKEALYRLAQLTEAESKLIAVAKTHENLSVRKEAIYRLAQDNPSSTAIRALEDFAYHDPEIAVQKEAVYRLAHLPDGFDRLVGVAQTHSNQSVRKEAIYRLAQHKTSPHTLETLAAVAFEDPEISVRKEAVYRIAQLATSESDQLLIRVAKSHPDRSVRKEAIYRLVQRATKKSVDTLANITFQDSDAKVQKEALYAIARLDNDTSIPLLIKIATTHDNPKLRKEAIYRLGQSEDKRAIEALEKIVLEQK